MHTHTHTRKIYYGHAFQDSPKGFNLVTLTDTTATAVLEDGGVYCQPDILFEGCSSTTHLLCTDIFFNHLSDKVTSLFRLPLPLLRSGVARHQLQVQHQEVQILLRHQGGDEPSTLQGALLLHFALCGSRNLLFIPICIILINSALTQ